MYSFYCLYCQSERHISVILQITNLPNCGYLSKAWGGVICTIYQQWETVEEVAHYDYYLYFYDALNAEHMPQLIQYGNEQIRINQAKNYIEASTTKGASWNRRK